MDARTGTEEAGETPAILGFPVLRRSATGF
jgi:hypothetical protein